MCALLFTIFLHTVHAVGNEWRKLECIHDMEIHRVLQALPHPPVIGKRKKKERERDIEFRYASKN